MLWRRLDTSRHSLIQLWQVREHLRWISLYISCSHCLLVPLSSVLCEQLSCFALCNSLVHPTRMEKHTMYCLYITVIVLIRFVRQMPLGPCHDPSSFLLGCINVYPDHRLLNLSIYGTLPNPTSTLRTHQRNHEAPLIQRRLWQLVL